MKEGRILKIKLGYNPNSSGIGTVVVVFIWGFAAVMTLMAIISGIIMNIGNSKMTKDSNIQKLAKN